MNPIKILISLLFAITLSLNFACTVQKADLPATPPQIQKDVTTSLIHPTPESTIAFDTLSEEDLAKHIHNATLEIENAAQTASTVLNEASSDVVLADGEISRIFTSLQTFQSAIDFADKLVDIYLEQYAEISAETTGVLMDIGADLNGLTENMNEMIVSLEQTGIEADQLSTAVSAAVLEASNIIKQSANWLSEVQRQIDVREKQYANIPSQPGIVAYNRVDAFMQAHDFLDAVMTAFDDEKLSPVELAEISQLGANAEASLYNTGDHQIFVFAQQINALSHHAFRGEWNQAREGMIALKFSLPAQPRP